jgi:small-conductance mechanosensitive channel
MAIPAAEVGPRSSELAASLRAMASRSDTSKQEQELDTGVVALQATVKSLAQYSREVLAEPGEAGRALELMGTWRPVFSQLNRSQASLRDRASRLAVDLEELRRAEQIWRKTAEAPEIQDAPTEIRERIQANRQGIQSGMAATTQQLSRTLLLQNQLTDVQIEVDAMQEAIRKEAERQRIGLLSFDSAPLWSLPALRNAAPKQPHGGPQLSQETAPWMREEGVELLLRLALFLLSLALSYFSLRLLRRRLLGNGALERQGLEALALILDRAWSTATFLAVMVNAAIQKGIPPALVSLGGMALAVPSLRLLPQLIGSNLYTPFYGLFGLIFAEELVSYLPAGGLGSRFGSLGVQVAAAVFYAWMGVMLQRRGTPGLWPQAVRWLVWASLIFAAISALANFVGMVKLAEYILGSVLFVGYAAMVVRGAAVICTELLSLANRSSFLAGYVEARGGVDASERRASRIINTLGVLAFLIAALYTLDLSAPFLAWADERLKASIQLGAIQISWYHLLAFVATLFFSMAISTVFRAGMEASVFRRLGWQTGQKDAISKILHYSILMFGFLIALFAAGVDFSSVAVLMGGLSVGLGFGLQNIMNNFVSGVILLFERPLQSGDLVTVGTTEGIVKDIGIRASVIKTGDGADVIVPNGQLLSSSLTNWSQSDQSRRFDVNVSASFEADPKEVMSILTQVAERNPLVMRQPAPLALFTQFGGSALEFQLRYWCHFSHASKLSTEIRTHIKEEFAKAGVEIPFPQTEIRMHGWEKRLEGGGAGPPSPGQV